MTKPRKSPVDDIGRRARRLRKAREEPGTSPLRGLGVFGMIGWSIAVPTVAGAFFGLWLDRNMPQDFQWTIALILGGVALGGFIAWAWVSKESGSDRHDD
ncbi:AtpZ/AtpI family protein [Vreelandella alkaliphila]|uniref:AtpZ/AtpI family protein n=1 Tax=Vreelandella alkaliphila TaxID=272774 RepID=A0AAJ2RSG9_9GAMM|nr:AtpZ/AtpI family protein [Halomonas alkaliphila]MDX5976626.1 AtpZ/AtpI family protein [Halomonas alkaliphila]